jgi:hypothetical protein
MSQKRTPFDINALRVAKPCSVGWDSMDGDDRSRMCAQCSLTVYNLEGLSKNEVFDLVGNGSERVCVRLRRRSGGTVITRDCPKGLAAYRRRLGRLASAAFAAILGLVSYSAAQTRPPTNDSRGWRSEISINASVVEGIVKDPTGVPIPGAVVTIKDASGKTLKKKKTGRTGYFRIMNANLHRGRNTITIESPGFNTYSDEFTVHPRELIYYPVILDVGYFVCVVVIAPPPQIDVRKSSISTTIRFD